MLYVKYEKDRPSVAASEEKSFENVHDGRQTMTTTDGRTPDTSIYYKLTGLRVFGLGELKMQE